MMCHETVDGLGGNAITDATRRGLPRKETRSPEVRHGGDHRHRCPLGETPELAEVVEPPLWLEAIWKEVRYSDKVHAGFEGRPICDGARMGWGCSAYELGSYP